MVTSSEAAAELLQLQTQGEEAVAQLFDRYRAKLARMVVWSEGSTRMWPMLERAVAYHEEDPSGRFVVETRHGGRVWAVIVEPSPEDRVLVVVTAFPIE